MDMCFGRFKMRQCCLKHQVLLWFVLLILCTMYTSADILVFSALARHQIEEEFRDMPAKFGGIIPAEGVKVYLFLLLYVRFYSVCVCLYILLRSQIYLYNCLFYIKI